MLTKVCNEDLLAIGARVRAEKLLAQADYTLKTATKEGRALESILPKGYLSEVRDTREQLAQARRSKVIQEAEKRDVEEFVTQAFHEAKVWRRQVAHRAQQALHQGVPVKEEIFRIREARTAEALSKNILQMIDLLEPHRDKLPGQDWEKVFQEGRRLAETLSATVAPSEKSLRDLPEDVREFYETKGQLYMALKVINDAGWALHSDSSTAAAKFNFETMYKPSREVH